MSELYHQGKEMYASRGVVTVHLINHDNTLAGSGKLPAMHLPF